MDNKKTGRFIAERRKEMNLSQKQLAEKLNVTDKAVSKWETGNGAPDISLLTVIADSLNVTVVELLDGQHSEKANAQAQTEKIVIEALKKAKKERIKTTISIFVVLAILFSLVNVVTYGYWGRRHKVLYNVDTVFVQQDKENPNKYDFYYNCTVKNWWFDFNKYTYNLVAELGGEPGGWYFESETNPITSNNLNTSSFVIHVEFDISTVYEPVPTLEEIIMMGSFSAYDVNGEYDSRANLFMNDFDDAKIIVI
ncbi:MAG: helix-turn-helix transcriptional regulator [Clostridia bacterium]|nr:helix-turn-helix transcriptional regulator [Clostridia bacterium]